MSTWEETSAAWGRIADKLTEYGQAIAPDQPPQPKPVTVRASKVGMDRGQRDLTNEPIALFSNVSEEAKKALGYVLWKQDVAEHSGSLDNTVQRGFLQFVREQQIAFQPGDYVVALEGAANKLEAIEKGLDDLIGTARQSVESAKMLVDEPKRQVEATQHAQKVALVRQRFGQTIAELFPDSSADSDLKRTAFLAGVATDLGVPPSALAAAMRDGAVAGRAA